MTKKNFPNGFTSWMETHHEIVTEMTLLLKESDYSGSTLTHQRVECFGMGGLYELAEELTDTFEKENEGREWDGDFLEVVQDYFAKVNTI